MGSIGRKLISFVTPRSLWGVAVATCGWLSLLLVWHLALDWVILGSNHHSFFEIAVEAVTVGGPFALAFVVGGWFQHKAVKALTRRAYFDPLSNVLNRQTFVNHFRKALETTPSGLLLLIDADHFKRVNDSYGHAMGDRCISAIGHRLQWYAREDDIAGRLGGEEFAIFLRDVSPQHGSLVATRIGQPIEFSDADQDLRVTVTLSIGAVWTSPDRSLEELFHDADDALYFAKECGRAQVRFAHSEEVIHLAFADEHQIVEPKDSSERSRSKLGAMLGG